MMRRGQRTLRRWLLVGSILLAGCSEQETAKLAKFGEKAYDRAAKAASSAGSELGVDLKNTRSLAADLEIVNRVRTRLLWDQQLHGAAIQVQVQADGILLSGTVRDEAQRQRALELAESTNGVRRVTHTLEISAPAR